MRINFQHQRAIQPSGGANTFIPEQEAPGPTMGEIRKQTLNQGLQAFNDISQASVVIARANQQAQEQEDQARLDEIELEAIEDGRKFSSGIKSNQEFSVVDDNLIFYPQDGYFGKSFQNGREKDFIGKLEAKYTDENRSNLFNQKLKVVIQKAVNPFLLNAQQQAIENTKNSVKVSTQKKVISISNQLSRGEITFDTALQNVSYEVEKYRPTLGTETDTTIIQAKKDLATQTALAMSSGDKTQRQSYRDLVVRETTGEQESNLGSLFWYQLHQSYGPQSLQLTKEESNVALTKSINSTHAPDLMDFIISYSQKGDHDYLYRDEKNGDKTLIVEPDIDALTAAFPELSKNVLAKAVYTAAKNYEKIINIRPKSDPSEWDKVKGQYSEMARKWVYYHRTKFARDERSRLSQMGVDNPPALPEDTTAIFDNVKDNSDYLQKNHELKTMASVFEWGKRILHKKIYHKSASDDMSWLNNQMGLLNKWFNKTDMSSSIHYGDALGYKKQIENDINQRISNYQKNKLEYEKFRDIKGYELKSGNEQSDIIIRGYIDGKLRED